LVKNLYIGAKIKDGEPCIFGIILAISPILNSGEGEIADLSFFTYLKSLL
jgi:hypothetical protein